MNLRLIRDVSDPEVTEGALYGEDGKKICYTLELPWKENKQKISCIPEGIYNYQKIFSSKFGRWVYRIENVPDRDLIDIHNGNTILDIEGCILVGNKRGVLTVKGRVYPAVLNSQDTLMKLLNVAGNQGLITITNGD